MARSLDAPLVDPNSRPDSGAPPPPTPARFWDGYAAKYAAKPVPDEDAYERTLERVRAYLTPNDEVLELGCGTGTTALKLAASARVIVATDYSAGMIDIATEKARLEGVTNVRFRQCTALDASFSPGSFDALLAMNLLHLIADIPALLARVHALLRPGGLFIAKTPLIGEKGLALRVAIPLLRWVGFAPYVNFVTERSLTAAVEAAGFELAERGFYPEKQRHFLVVARKAPLT